VSESTKLQLRANLGSNPSSATTPRSNPISARERNKRALNVRPVLDWANTGRMASGSEFRFTTIVPQSVVQVDALSQPVAATRIEIRKNTVERFSMVS